MDLSGTQVCMLCALPMLGGQPKMEMMCAHVFHTECLVVAWYDELDCPTCHTPVFTQQVTARARTQHQQTIQQREEKFLEDYRQNKSLKHDLKLIKKQVANLRRAKAAFGKVASQKRRDWRTDAKPLFQLLRVKQKEALRSVQVSSEIKTWKSERTKLTRLVNRFETKYTNYTFHELLDYRSLKLPTIWDYRQLRNIRSWTIYRYFRLYGL
jgi:hypothetical protein